ncbi:MAG TPA: hypothetical protein VH396_00110 [Chitinophagaceae bacterium]|jgi:hypothetical protein
MRYLFSTFFLLLFSSGSFLVKCQVSINGPTCVRAGLEYQYIINGNGSSESAVQICVRGGIIADSSSSCIADNSFSQIRVIWDFNISESTIALTSAEGDTLITVSISDTLRPGIIDSVFKKQTIEYNDIPANIICSVARGGSCSPAYTYQWQRSIDNIEWENIEGSTSKNLSFSDPVIQPTFFRRKVVEINSNSVDYSDVAAVYINEALQ